MPVDSNESACERRSRHSLARYLCLSRLGLHRMGRQPQRFSRPDKGRDQPVSGRSGTPSCRRGDSPRPNADSAVSGQAGSGASGVGGRHVLGGLWRASTKQTRSQTAYWYENLAASNSAGIGSRPASPVIAPATIRPITGLRRMPFLPAPLAAKRPS